MSDLARALARLQERHPKRIDLGLERVLGVLKRLGDPHQRLAPTIHIAGTNGKGSTLAFLGAIAEAGGQRVHTFTSPHLVRFNERIVLAGQEASDEALCEAFARVEAASNGEPLSFFEAVTAAAFLLYAETPADWLLLEVGLGGRLDATNVIAPPHASVITPVGIDHAEFLGDTIGAIAGEKAGILKEGAPGVIGPQSMEAQLVIEERARELGIQLFSWGRDFDARLENGRMIVETENQLFDLDAPSLLGSHQIINAGTAIMAALVAGLADAEAPLSQGLRNASWPGRLQRLQDGEAAQLAGGELWIDGAHNVMAAGALAQTLADITDRDPLPLVMICGMQKNKDADAFFARFAGLVRHVVCVALESAQSAHPPEVLADIARGHGMSAETAPSLHAALTLAGDLIDEDHVRVIAAGSLYLVGEILNFGSDQPRLLTFG
jgi:dihydrofolate synthase/folylpolyglutamate synthase